DLAGLAQRAAVRPSRRHAGDAIATCSVEARDGDRRRDPRRYCAGRRPWRRVRATAHHDPGDRRDRPKFEWLHRGTMISVKRRNAYHSKQRIPRKRRESMLRRISIIVVAGLSSCSSADRAHQVRDPTQTTELGIFMKTRINPSFSKISFLLFHE